MADFHAVKVDINDGTTATDATPEQQVQLRLEPKVRSKIAWFSRKSKANSVALQERESFWRDTTFNEGSGKYRNSMPVDISLFEESFSFLDSEELDDDHAESPDLYIKKVREELEALKGFVAERRSFFSPPHSPELQVVNDADPLTAVAKELTAEYSSSSESIVLPISEYSVQVPPFIPTNESQSPTFSRQASLEYDHLEEKKDDVAQEKDCPDGFHDGGTCFVTLQYVEDKCQSEVISCDGSPQRKRSLVSISENTIQENCDIDDFSVPVGMHTHSPFLLRQREHSSSIPGRLDSPSLMKSPLRHHHNLLSQQQWNSTSHIRDEHKEPCHCPACCSCGSSQRQLTPSGSFESKNSLPTQTRTSNNGLHTLPRLVNTCPLKRYTCIVRTSSSHTSKSSSLQRKLSSIAAVPNVADARERDFAVISNSDADNISRDAFLHDADDESICSLQSAQSATTRSSCCCNHSRSLYNQGVDGSMFKERMKVCISACFCTV